MKKIVFFIVFPLIIAWATGILLFLINTEPTNNPKSTILGIPGFKLKQNPMGLSREFPWKKDKQTVSRENRHGRDYIPISVYELYTLCDKGGIENFQQDAFAFVLRGVILSDGMPTNGHSGLFRATQWCCAGHEVAWGFRLQVAVPETIDGGDWVKVYGRVKKVTATDNEVKLTTPLAPTSKLRNDYELLVDHMETTQVPKEIYTTYWSIKEPFHF